MRRQRDEAWQLVTVLARIAVAKHRGVQRSLPWTALGMAGSVGWLLLVALAT